MKIDGKLNLEKKKQDNTRRSSKSEAEGKVDTVGSMTSSSSEKNVDFKVNENDDTIAIEEQIKENITDDHILKHKDENNINLIDQLSMKSRLSNRTDRNAISLKDDLLNCSQNDVKEMLPELTKRASYKNNLKIKEPKRVYSLTKTNELISTISETPFTSSNRDKRKFNNYSQIKNYLDESNFNNSTLQTDPNSMKKNILNITGSFDKSKQGQNKNIGSYAPLNQSNKPDNDNESKVLEISQINNYEKINNDSVSFSTTKEMHHADDERGYNYNSKDLDIKKSDSEDTKSNDLISTYKKKHLFLAIVIVMILCLGIIYIIIK